MTDLQFRPTPKTGEEKELLRAFLNNYRATMVWKLDGVSDDDAARPMVPSGTNLIGLVKHLAFVELYWLVEVFAGQPVEYPYSDEDPDADLRAEPGDTVDSITDLYRRHISRANAVISGADLDDVSAGDQGGNRFSLRWILVHLIEETARHAGHADILREQIDGAVGAFPR